MEALPQAVFFSQTVFIATWAYGMALISPCAPDSRTASAGRWGEGSSLGAWGPLLPAAIGAAGRPGSRREGCPRREGGMPWLTPGGRDARAGREGCPGSRRLGGMPTPEGCSAPGRGGHCRAARPGRQRPRDNEACREPPGQGRPGRQGPGRGEGRRQAGREAGPARPSWGPPQVPGRPLPSPGGGRLARAGASRLFVHQKKKKKSF